MADTVFVNGRAVVHAGSAGKSVAAFPDVCLCPPTPPAGPVPTPLPNNATAADLAGGASSVTTDGNPIAKKSSYISRSTGNESARPTGGGVVTHVVQGKACFASYSMDVLVEGENVPRHLDLTTHNHASPPGNTPPWPWLAAMAALPPPAAAPAVAAQFKVVEIVEVVTHGGIQKTRPPYARRQYINVDPAVDPGKPHPEYGRSVQLKARLAQTAGAPAPLAGKQVHWYFTPHRSNKAGLAGAEREGFDAAGSGVKQKATPVDAAGWTPIVTFFLSQYGGDRFRVGATEDPAYVNGRKSGVYAVWRQLWFEVDTMKARGGGLLTMKHEALPAVFRKVFIRLLKQGKDNRPANKWNVDTLGCHPFADDYFGAERSPFQVHEVAIDHQADPDPSGIQNIQMTHEVWVDPNKMTYYRYNGGKTWLNSAAYLDTAGNWQPIPPANVTLIGKHKVEKRLRISLKGLPVAPSAAHPVQIRISVVYSNEWGGDGANQPHAMIAMGYYYDTQIGSIARKKGLRAMAHELGHVIGMVPATSPAYSPGSTGPHCSQADCIMYYTLANLKIGFCNDCVEALRRTDLVAYKPSFTHAKGPKA